MSLDIALDKQIQAAIQNQGESNYLDREEDEKKPLFEQIMMESGDHYDRCLSLVAGLQDHDRVDYMRTESRIFLLERIQDQTISLEDAIDILEYERHSEMEFDLDFMKHLVESNERFRIRMSTTDGNPGEAFITEYAAYLENRKLFTERTEFLKKHGKYNPLNEG